MLDQRESKSRSYQRPQSPRAGELGEGGILREIFFFSLNRRAGKGSDLLVLRVSSLRAPRKQRVALSACADVARYY
jgi:hypothetical protein